MGSLSQNFKPISGDKIILLLFYPKMENKFELINSSKRDSEIGITPTLRTNQENSFFLKKSVKERKNDLLRERLQTLIRNRGWSNHEFYLRAGISRQYYYFISWGLWNPPLDIKIKIAKHLGVDSALIWREEENGRDKK